MSDREQQIQAMIERSSLGSQEARNERSKVSSVVGREIARAAISGQYISRTRQNKSPRRQG